MFRSSLVKRSIKGLVIFMSVAMLANLIFHLIGFGQAPLVILDEEIEYYLKPKMSYRRFGNDINVNRYSMRSVDFDHEKQHAFYAIIGDSVVYGEHTIDQTQTLAYILNSQLKLELQDESVVVGSIAASSWGPGNMLAFYERFGPFVGNTAFLVLSSHDRFDIPYMTRRLTPYRVLEPTSALHDFLQSVGERLEDKVRGDLIELPLKRRLSLSEASLVSLIELLKRDYVKVVMVFHATRKEAINASSKGETYYATIAQKNKVGFYSTLPFYKALYEKGIDPHGDNIHLSWQGNQQLSTKLSELISD
jgi:hypothetical protein